MHNLHVNACDELLEIKRKYSSKRIRFLIVSLINILFVNNILYESKRKFVQHINITIKIK